MRGDSIGALGRSTREESADLFCQSGLKVLIDPDAAGTFQLANRTGFSVDDVRLLAP